MNQRARFAQAEIAWRSCPQQRELTASRCDFLSDQLMLWRLASLPPGQELAGQER
jgi:hypothetical protein